MGELEVTVVLGAPDPEEWSRICNAAGATFFQRPEWLVPWYESFAPGPIRALEARLNGELRGILPLRGNRFVQVSPTNWHTPMFAPVAADEAALLALLEAATGRARALTLRFIPETDATVTTLQNISRVHGTVFRSRVLLQSPRVLIRSPWEDYERGLSRNLVKSLRRRWKRLGEMGEVHIETVSNSNVDDALSEGLALEAAGWKGQRGTAIAAQEQTRRFYGRVAENAASSNRLLLSFLRLDGRAIAFHFDIVDGNVIYGLKGTYAEDMAQISPSRLLRHEMIRRAFEENRSSYEFLGTDEGYKEDWANDRLTLLSLANYQPSPIGRLLYLADMSGRPMVRRVAHQLAHLKNHNSHGR